MKLTDQDKEYVALALESHRTCVHEKPHLCSILIVTEVELRRGKAIESDEEFEAMGHCIADLLLESLILKGLVETVGVTEDGEFLIGLTPDGEQVELENRETYKEYYEELRKEENE